MGCSSLIQLCKETKNVLLIAIYLSVLVLGLMVIVEMIGFAISDGTYWMVLYRDYRNIVVTDHIYLSSFQSSWEAKGCCPGRQG